MKPYFVKALAPRLAIRMILSGSWADLAAMLAPVCSSFCTANQGTAARDLLNGWGNFFHPSISRGNKLMSRTKSCSSSLFKTECLSDIFGSLIKAVSVFVCEDNTFGSSYYRDGLPVPIGATGWVVSPCISPCQMVHPGHEADWNSCLMTFQFYFFCFVH